MLKVFLNHLTLGNSSVIEQMEKLYILISLTALFAFSSSLCVTEDEGKDGIDLRCSSRWSGEGSKIRRLIVHSWDGSCHFPEGGLLTLYGADQDCFTCSKSIHERMMVNGEKCTVAVPTARSESKISGSSRTTTGSIDFTTELYEAVWQVKGSIHGTTTTAAETYSASSSLQELCILVTVALVVKFLKGFNWQPHPLQQQQQQQQQHRRFQGGRELVINQPHRALRPQRARRQVQRLQISW
ncbi:uncharacterized protein LOC132717885 isoform X1 [Ruditapes philippinarum]|uniref:uncharacterized protein LOC132717885 isoform X1 n=1 Tax=Ruditapes philippinarum TaxID=129788 RepID=UPI00295B5CE9|nr:uncharacterized protein LOC132717885 isoform X1 [Ruditapes philippinarum]